MERCKGQELFEYVVSKSKLLESEAVCIVTEILKTLNYLHSLGLVHRDLKPENIIYDGTTKRLKIIDFGLATFFTDQAKLHN